MHPIDTTRFPNGFSVVSRRLPGTRSVALGLWLYNGSRHERPDQHGYAHLLEHLFFKGCGELDARDIARLTDRWGGQINAFTGRELTALHGWVPADRQVDLASLLINMLLDTRFSADDLAAEQGVVLQEMAGQADAPDEAAESLAVQLACGDNPLGREILGTTETVEAATVEGLQAYRRGLLQSSRLALVAVGAVDHAALSAAAEALAALPAGERPDAAAPVIAGGEHAERRRTEQHQLVWVLPAPGIAAADYPAAALANHLLGGGVSSRLFQEIRERLGLVYDIRSTIESYVDCGLWIIQTACRPRDRKRCRQAIERCIDELAAQGPSAQEVADARDYLAAALTLEEDAQETHMERLAREHFYLGRHPSLEERLAQLAQVSPQRVAGLLTHAWSARYRLSWGPGA
jgi:predicted Zn-dependent peptidase